MSSIWSFLCTIVSRPVRLASVALLAVAFLAVAQSGAAAHQAHKPAVETEVKSGLTMTTMHERQGHALAAADVDHGGMQHHGRANGLACCDVLAGGCTPLGFGAADTAPIPAVVEALVAPRSSAAARVRFPEIELPPPR